MKSVIYEFDSVIYPFSLLVSKNFDSKELGDMFYCVEDNNGLVDSPETFIPERRTIARTIQVSKKGKGGTHMLVLLCRPGYIGSGTVTHESLHVTNIVAEWLGFLPAKAMEDEPCAYLAQWVSNCIDCVLKGHPERMNGIEFVY